MTPLSFGKAFQKQPSPDQPEETRKAKFEGFDYLRAIFSIAIVADHAGLFLLAGILGVDTLTDLLYANVSYVGVPVFFQISIFLFYLKREKVGFHYFIKKRLPKLIFLYLFWVTSKVMFDILLKGSSEIVRFETLSVRKLVEFTVSGGNSPFYFFFSLLFLTIAAEILVSLFRKLGSRSLKIRTTYYLLWISCILVFSFSIIDLIINHIGDREIAFISILSSIARWNYNPLNFLPYLFTTAIVVQEFNEGKLKQINSSLKLKLYTLLSLFLIFTLLEWNLLENLVHYSRLSLVFGSWLLLYLALLSTHQPPAIIKFISSCSLGIYALHLFFTHSFFTDDSIFFIPLSQISPGLSIVVKFFVALIGSIVLTLVFRKTRVLENFV